MLAAVIATSAALIFPGPAPVQASMSDCANACAQYLQDDSAVLQCNLQCLEEHTAFELEVPSADAPDWMPTSDATPVSPTDHDWCLQTCDDESDSETDRETCKLNCAVSWSVLSSTPAVCEGPDADDHPDLCVSEAASSCERGCYANSVTCRDTCEEADARPTDIASCKLRCENVSDLCSRSCTSEDPDEFVSTEWEYNHAREPGC